jgi:RNA polymerase sigma factor (sigma-70 family)
LQINFEVLPVKIKHIEDNELWKLMIKGDENAFESIYRVYFQVLYSYGKQLIKDHDLVNDAIQDLFLDIWRTKTSLSPAESVQFYLMRSLRRRIHRSKENTDFTENIEEITDTVLLSVPSYESSFIVEEDEQNLSRKISTWLERLPERQKEAVMLRFFHNFEYNEIAKILNIQEQTTRNLVQKGLQILRKISIPTIIFIIYRYF